MPYVITKSDGTTLATLADSAINSTVSSLSLAGRGVSNYGLPIANDLVHLLENFAHTSSPAYPLVGQLWYDKSTTSLRIWNGTAWSTSLTNYVAHNLTDTGTANTYVTAYSATPLAYVAGMTATIKILNTNTGPSTLNLNGLGAVGIVFPDGSPILAGQLVAGGEAQFLHNGTNFVLMTAPSNTVSASAIQKQTNTFALATGTLNNYVVNLYPAPAAYTVGMIVSTIIPSTNTGPSTINVNSLGVKTILNPDGTSLNSNQLATNGVVTLFYDGANFQVTTSSTSSAEKMLADRTYYVSPGGSNANSGRSNVTPFLTLQYAYDYITKNIDANGHYITIQVADGTYTNAGGGVTAITSAVVNGVGSGLTNGTRLFTVSGGTGTPCTFTALVSSGAVVPGTVVISNPGAYTVVPSTTANLCTVDVGTTTATFNLTAIIQSNIILQVSNMPKGISNTNPLQLLGNRTTPDNVKLVANNGSCIYASGTIYMDIQGVSFSATGIGGSYYTAGVGITASSGATIYFGYCTFFNCDASHIETINAGQIGSLSRPYSIKNDRSTQPQYHIQSITSGNVTNVLSTVSIYNMGIGYPAYAQSFITSQYSSYAGVYQMTFVNGNTGVIGSAGLATGKQAIILNNGVANTNAAGVDYLPGDRYSTNPNTVYTATGGIYV